VLVVLQVAGDAPDVLDLVHVLQGMTLDAFRLLVLADQRKARLLRVVELDLGELDVRLVTALASVAESALCDSLSFS